MQKLTQHCIWAILIISTCASCSYFQSYQHWQHEQDIESSISISKLESVNQYTSRTPYHKTYEFEFENIHNNTYALIFYFNESSFSKSIVKYRNQTDLHRDAIRIDENEKILARLNNHLPHARSIFWQQVANEISKEEARDGYQILREYIRLKIRDL